MFFRAVVGRERSGNDMLTNILHELSVCTSFVLYALLVVSMCIMYRYTAVPFSGQLLCELLSELLCYFTSTTAPSHAGFHPLPY